jgi:hypothetical protein
VTLAMGAAFAKPWLRRVIFVALAGCRLRRAGPDDVRRPRARFRGRPAGLHSVATRSPPKVERDDRREAQDGDGPCRHPPGHDRRRHRRGRGLLHRSSRRAGRRSTAASSPRTSTGMRSPGSASGSARAARQRLDQAGDGRRPAPAAGQLRPHLPGPHVPRGHEPYAFLWRLRPALRKGGQVIVVDVDRPTDQHGIPPAAFLRIRSRGLSLDRICP